MTYIHVTMQNRTAKDTIQYNWWGFCFVLESILWLGLGTWDSSGIYLQLTYRSVRAFQDRCSEGTRSGTGPCVPHWLEESHLLAWWNLHHHIPGIWSMDPTITGGKKIPSALFVLFLGNFENKALILWITSLGKFLFVSFISLEIEVLSLKKTHLIEPFF